MLAATWAGIGAIVLFNIVGWVLAYVHRAKNEAKHMGRLEEQVKGLADRVGGLEGRFETLQTRIDNFLLIRDNCDEGREPAPGDEP